MTVWWIIPAPSATPRTRRSVTDAPAYFQSKRHAAIYGFAMPIDPMLNGDGLAQAETRQRHQEQLLAWHRGQLIEELAQRRKAHRATCSVLSDLQEATHAILAMGEA